MNSDQPSATSSISQSSGSNSQQNQLETLPLPSHHNSQPDPSQNPDHPAHESILVDNQNQNQESVPLDPPALLDENSDSESVRLNNEMMDIDKQLESGQILAYQYCLLFLAILCMSLWCFMFGYKIGLVTQFNISVFWVDDLSPFWMLPLLWMASQSLWMRKAIIKKDLGELYKAEGFMSWSLILNSAFFFILYLIGRISETDAKCFGLLIPLHSVHIKKAGDMKKLLERKESILGTLRDDNNFFYSAFSRRPFWVKFLESDFMLYLGIFTIFLGLIFMLVIVVMAITGKLED